MLKFIERVVRLALMLYDGGAFLDRRTIRKNNPDGKGFRFKHHEKNPDAELSPSYINLRAPENDGPLTPEMVREIAGVFYEMVTDCGAQYDCVCGIPKAGEPFADAFAEIFLAATGNRLPVIRLGKSEDGSGRRVGGVLGDFKPGWRVLLIDDLITKALTKIEALWSLLQAGLIVADLVLLVDREQGGIEELAEKFPNLRVHVVFTHTALLDIYVEHGRITPELREEIIGYCQRNR